MFEHLFFTQLRALASARDAELRISTFRTEHGAEVDFIIEAAGLLWAVECKASRNVGPADLRGFRSFGEVTKRKHRQLVAYLGDTARTISGVDVLPWQEALREIDAAITQQ